MAGACPLQATSPQQQFDALHCAACRPPETLIVPLLPCHRQSQIQVSDAGLATLASLTRLESLHLGGAVCGVGEQACAAFARRLRGLTALHITDCPALGDSALCRLAPLAPGLFRLGLSGCGGVTNIALTAVLRAAGRWVDICQRSHEPLSGAVDCKICEVKNYQQCGLAAVGAGDTSKHGLLLSSDSWAKPVVPRAALQAKLAVACPPHLQADAPGAGWLPRQHHWHRLAGGRMLPTLVAPPADAWGLVGKQVVRRRHAVACANCCHAVCAALPEQVLSSLRRLTHLDLSGCDTIIGQWQQRCC